MEIELIQRLAVAMGIGLLVGVERGWREREAGAGMRTAGIRTFTLTGLLGGIIGAIGRVMDNGLGTAIIFGVGFIAFTAAFGAFRMRELMREESYGATTLVAAMATFALGAYALIGDEVVAAGLGVVIVIVLAMREAAHGLLTRITWRELRAAIVLAAMTFLAIPIIPDQSYGPFGGVNPRQVWILAVVLAAVSFGGYVAVRRFGAGRGLLVAAAAGGLVSSTAVHLTAARRAARGDADAKLLAASSVLASGVSFVRTIAIVLALNAAVALHAGVPLALAAVVSSALAFLLARENLSADTKSDFKLRNPFSLPEVFTLALLLGGVLFLTQAATAIFGSAGAMVAAVLAGFVDLDSVAYSMAELGRGPLLPDIAAVGLLLAVAANTVFKLASGMVLAGRAFTVPLTIGLGLSLAAGGAVMLLLLVI